MRGGPLPHLRERKPGDSALRRLLPDLRTRRPRVRQRRRLLLQRDPIDEHERARAVRQRRCGQECPRRRLLLLQRRRLQWDASDEHEAERAVRQRRGRFVDAPAAGAAATMLAAATASARAGAAAATTAAAGAPAASLLRRLPPAAPARPSGGSAAGGCTPARFRCGALPARRRSLVLAAWHGTQSVCTLSAPALPPPSCTSRTWSACQSRPSCGMRIASGSQPEVSKAGQRRSSSARRCAGVSRRMARKAACMSTPQLQQTPQSRSRQRRRRSLGSTRTAHSCAHRSAQKGKHGSAHAPGANGAAQKWQWRTRTAAPNAAAIWTAASLLVLRRVRRAARARPEEAAADHAGRLTGRQLRGRLRDRLQRRVLKGGEPLHAPAQLDAAEAEGRIGRRLVRARAARTRGRGAGRRRCGRRRGAGRHGGGRNGGGRRRAGRDINTLRRWRCAGVPLSFSELHTCKN